MYQSATDSNLAFQVQEGITVELTQSPMNDRQRTYREVYRDRIAAWYNGYLHVAIIYTIGFCALFVYLSHLQNVQWWEWLAIPVVFLASNIFEWWIHAQVMHRPRKWKGFRAIYTRHMLMHHQFFTDEEMRFAGHHDWRVTVFPPYALVVFILISTRRRSSRAGSSLPTWAGCSSPPRPASISSTSSCTSAVTSTRTGSFVTARS